MEKIDQVTLMFKESNSRMSAIMSGKFDPNSIMAAQSEFRGQIKLVSLVINAVAIATKDDKAFKSLKNKNMLSDKTFVGALK